MTFLKRLSRVRHAFVKYKISRIERDLGFLEFGIPYDIKYYPSCQATITGVTITIMTGAFSGLSPGYHVSPPNILESLLGITFEDKINRTYRKVQSRCDKMNMAEASTTPFISEERKQ